MNTAPFVSTPFAPEEESMQAICGATIPEPHAMQPVPLPMPMDEMDDQYPEIYQEVYPFVIDAADKMMAGGYTPAPEAIGIVVDNIIKASGLWYEDEDDNRPDRNQDVMPVQAGFGHSPFRRRRRRHHSRDTLRDITRILLLRELFGRRHGFPRHHY